MIKDRELAVAMCNGLEPCVGCDEAGIPCTYETLSEAKRKIHDAYVRMKKQEQSQRLKNSDVIVARMGELEIAGTSNNFGPLFSHIINLPRYEPPPSDFKNDKQLIREIRYAEMMLIDCYFKHFNYYIPILNRQTFMEQVNDPKQLTTMEVQKLLACVLATGFAFRRELGEPDVIQKMEPNYGKGMCRKFHYFNAHGVLVSSIENCQAYLILTGFYSSIADYDAVHNLVALAHSITATLQLNRTQGIYYQSPFKRVKDHTKDTIELGHRIFWSVVIVCSGYSLSHQSPFITSNDYNIPFPQRRPSDKHPDFQGVEQDDFEGIQYLGHFAPMYEISSRVADITCTATKQRPHTKVDEVRGMLEEWRRKTLPPELRITPTDIGAIERQSRFSKLYHAVSYMFEICLHHTFQLHESHRELGIHGIWSSYCYDAAVGILNIYRTRPMSRMNSHVILPVAAGAFANIVASKLLGKEESAQQYCDEIKAMLTDIVKASTSMERSKLLKYVDHGYMGVTQNATAKVDPLGIRAPELPPSNENSPAQTTSSSPSQMTDRTGDTDAFSSEEEEDIASDRSQDSPTSLNKRMSGQFGYVDGQQVLFPQQNQSNGFRRQQQQVPAQHRPHPSAPSRAPSNPSLFPTEPQHQRHPTIESNYTTNGYSGIIPGSMQSPVSAGGYTGAVVSPGFPPYGDSTNAEEFAFGNRRHLQHRTPSDQSLTGDFNDGADSGFASSHGHAVDQDAYFGQRSNAHHQQQQHQSFSTGAGQSVNGDGNGDGSGGLSRAQHHSAMISNSTTGSSGVFAINEILGVDLDALGHLGQGIWRQQLNDAQLNDAQLMKLHEYQQIKVARNLTLHEAQELEDKLQQQIIALASPTSQTHFSESYSHQGQYMIQQPQQQHSHHSQHHQYQSHQQQHQSYSGIDNSVPGSLNSSRLLSGVYDGTGSITGLGFVPGDLTQDAQRLYHQMMIPSMTSISSKSISDPSDLASPLTPTSAHHSHQQHQQQQQSMGMSNHDNNNSTIENLMGYHSQQQGGLNMSSFSSGLDPTDEGIMICAATLQQEGTSGVGLGGAGGIIVGPEGLFVGSDFENAILNGGGGGGVVVDSVTGAMDILDCMNDPNMVIKQQMFSSVASKSHLANSNSGYNGNSISNSNSTYTQQQQRPHPYHQAR
ncbi:hypothetical protein EDD21DRAFT_406035 [Dissophora ornata]|nr:hypothetical protein EDD21DRAFT_406035 [Dissophora ornata]